MSGFVTIRIPRKGIRPGRRFGIAPIANTAYRLDYSDARSQHDAVCPGNGCWSVRAPRPIAFFEGLLEHVLGPAGFRVNAMRASRTSFLELADGPGGRGARRSTAPRCDPAERRVPRMTASTWEALDLPFLRTVAQLEGAQGPDVDQIVAITGFGRTEVANHVRSPIESNHLKGLDASSFAALDYIDLRLSERGRNEVG